jgi:D-alanyl-D-alanine carboxypeptidase (penicillin-binding protein 5/6)
MLLPPPRRHEPHAGTPFAPGPVSRRRALLLLGALLLSAPSAQARHFLFHDYGPAPTLTPPDRIQAVAALLIDAQTGQILYARNPNMHLLPASTTKLMTALIVRERLGNRGLTGSVRVEEQDRAEPSNIPIVPGETISVFNLFHALLIESANDSARTLGRWVSPNDTVDGFVDMMNEKALAMGLLNTHFHNPNGLPAPAGTHYTSCADLMKIFQAVLRYPDLRQILSTLDFYFRSASGFHHLHNHNRLLAYYPGMGPAKTGWTVASKHTYAASCKRGGRELLLTLLDSQDKWSDAVILFNWGFAQSSTPGENASADVESTGGPSLSSVPEVPSLPPAPAGRADGR